MHIWLLMETNNIPYYTIIDPYRMKKLISPYTRLCYIFQMKSSQYGKYGDLRGVIIVNIMV